MSLDELVHHMAGMATPTRRTGAVAEDGVWNKEKTCELRSCTGGILLRWWAGAPSRTRCP